MAKGILFQHLLVPQHRLLQAIQEHVYGKIAKAWSRENPDHPVFYPSAMVLAVAGGLHRAWSRGELTGDQVARALKELVDCDGAKLPGARKMMEPSAEAPVSGPRRIGRFGVGPVEPS